MSSSEAVVSVEPFDADMCGGVESGDAVGSSPCILSIDIMGPPEEIPLPLCSEVKVECVNLPDDIPALYDPFVCRILFDRDHCPQAVKNGPLTFAPGAIKDFFLHEARDAKTVSECVKACEGAHEGDHADYYGTDYPDYPSRPELETRGWSVSKACYQGCKQRLCGWFASDSGCEALPGEISLADAAVALNQCLIGKVPEASGVLSKTCTECLGECYRKVRNWDQCYKIGCEYCKKTHGPTSSLCTP